MGSEFVIAHLPLSQFTDERSKQIKRLVRYDMLSDGEGIRACLDALGDHPPNPAEEIAWRSWYVMEMAGMSDQLWIVDLPGLPYRLVITGGYNQENSPSRLYRVVYPLYIYDELWHLLRRFSEFDHQPSQRR